MLRALKLKTTKLGTRFGGQTIEANRTGFLTYLHLFISWCPISCLALLHLSLLNCVLLRNSRFNAGFCDVPSLERELIKGVPQPTLICVGGQANGGGPEGGKTSQEAAACFEAGMQNARAVVVPEGKRLLPWQNPEAVADSLADFMENT